MALPRPDLYKRRMARRIEIERLGIPPQAYFSSDTIAWAKYDEDRSILRLKFKDGGIYRYWDVPLRVYKGLLKAPSKGVFYHQYIFHRFECEKIGEELLA